MKTVQEALDAGLCSVWDARPMINDTVWEEYHIASMDALNALRPEYPPEMLNSLVLIQQAIDTVAAGNDKVEPGTTALDKYCRASYEAELANMGRAT